MRKRSAFSTRFGVRTSPSRSGSSPSRTSSSRIRSSIWLFYIALFCASVAAQPQKEDPDALYRDRSSLPSARAAATIWESRLKANPQNFEVAWKISRVMYWLGSHEQSQEKQRAALERGVETGQQATKLQPGRPEGHFWTAANMGTLAESYGLRQGLKYRGTIKDELETVLKIDPAYQHGSADRALGRWYNRVPGLFGGSNKKSEEHLRKSLTYNPQSTVSRFFLAETLLELDRESEAVTELQKVIVAPYDPEWEPEDREYKKKASDLLADIRAKRR